MEYRKIIKFGGNSYVISLPIDWIKSNNLEKGNPLFVEYDREKIIISPSLQINSNKTKEFVINIDKNTREKSISRKIFTAYTHGYDRIIIQGNNMSDFSEKIIKWLERYVALELVEQTSNKLVIDSYVNIEDVDILSFVKRIDNTIKSTMIDLKDCFDKNSKINRELIETIIQRKHNIDRIKRLLYRVINERLISKSVQNQNPLELLRYWETTRILEKISHEIKYIARIVCRKIDKKEGDLKNETISGVISEIKQLFEKVMIAFYKYDRDKSDELGYEINEFKRNVYNDFCNNKKHKKHIILNIVSYIKDLNRLSH